MFALRLRGLTLVIGGFVCWFPVMYVEALVLNPFFPPKPIAIDEGRLID
jgi:hypothetical protein